MARSVDINDPQSFNKVLGTIANFEGRHILAAIFEMVTFKEMKHFLLGLYYAQATYILYHKSQNTAQFLSSNYPHSTILVVFRILFPMYVTYGL